MLAQMNWFVNSLALVLFNEGGIKTFHKIFLIYIKKKFKYDY